MRGRRGHATSGHRRRDAHLVLMHAPPPSPLSCRVRWYIAGLGTEDGMHNFHWHGNTFETDGHRVDQLMVIPASTAALDFVPVSVGR